MPISEDSVNTRSRHWLRMPAPESGADFELFTFTGIAIFDKLQGTSRSDWEGGDATINADYTNVIASGKAILPRHWTVDVHLASISNLNVANNTGWSVNRFSLMRFDNRLGGTRIAVPGGRLRLLSKIAVRDTDAFILRLSYHVTILGRVVDWESTIVID